jgi:anti-sigma B factor antagonist
MRQEQIPAETPAASGYSALVLDRLAKQTCQVVGSVASSIFAHDSRVPGTAIAVAGCGRHEEFVGSRFRLTDDFPGEALGSDGGSEEAGAAVPACWNGETRGALMAAAVPGGQFGLRELDILGELARTAGAALKHAERRDTALRSVRARVREMVHAIDTHDGYTAGHSEDVVQWCCLVGERLRLSAPDVHELELGALLHDLGKVRIPDGILRKPGPLDAAERRLVNRHPVWGAEFIEGVPGLEPHPRREPDHRGLRRLPGDDLGPHLQEGAPARCRGVGAVRGSGHAVRPRHRRLLHRSAPGAGLATRSFGRGGTTGNRRNEVKRNYSVAHRALTADTHVIAVGGELDMSAAPDLRATIDTALDDGAVTLVVDLGEATFIDSTGIGTLMATLHRLKELGGTLEIVCVEPNLLRVFEIVGLDRQLSIHPTTDAALAAFAGTR